MDMRSRSSRLAGVVSLSLISALVLCQVIGGFCMMSPPAVEAATTIHGVHAWHPMGEGRMCQDSVPSPFKSIESFPGSTHLVVKLSALPLDSVIAVNTVFSQDSSPPRYARLSTFRI